MNKFEFLDETIVEFPDFEIKPEQQIGVYLPAIKNGRSMNGTIYVNDEDFLIYKGRHSYKAKEYDKNKVRVGVLAVGTSHPFKPGTYIPFKFTNYGGAEHCMSELYGDVQIHPNYIPKE